jgi:hypothetical protein
MNRVTAVATAGIFATAVAALTLDAVRPGTFRGSVARIVPDFGVYFPAAQLAADGQNPYDFARLAEAEAKVDPNNDPLPAMSPPWALATLVPLTPFEYEPARVAWFFVNLGILTACGGALWNLYDGDPTRAAFGPLLAVVGYPAIQALGLGQFSAFTLAGLVLFVSAERAGRPLLAGCGLAFLLVKPQTQVVVAVAVGLWVIDRRAWRILLGAGVGVGVLSVLVGFANPAIFAEYFESLRAARPPDAFRPPLPGTLLRLASGWDKFWLTFVPLPIGVAWCVWWYVRNRVNWNWAERMPVLVIVSYLASPYGWAYDHLVFLFAVVGLASRASRRPGPGALLVVAAWVGMVVYYRVMIANRFDEFHWVWLPPLLLILASVTRPSDERSGDGKKLQSDD